MKKLSIVIALIISGCGSSEPDVPVVPEVENRYISISFDDGASVKSVAEHMWLFERYGAKITAFVSHAPSLVNDPDAVDALYEIIGNGHEVAYHSTWHKNAVVYSQDNGIDAWYEHEISHGVNSLIGAGISVSTFAYPFGSRNSETDSAVSGDFTRVRGFTTEYEKAEPSSGYVVMGYSIDDAYLDLNKVFQSMDEVEPGETIYFASHVVGGWDNGWHISAEDLESILSYAQSTGFTFCTVGDCP